MRLSENIRSMLELQYKHELRNSLIYTQMRAWSDYKGFNNIAEFYKRQSEEEHGHANKVYEYIADKSDILNVEPFTFDNISPPFASGDVYSLFKASMDTELGTTASLCAILDASMNEKDFMTADFIRDMVFIQREEEKTFQQLLDRMDRYPNAPARENDIDLYIKETFLG
jgi:ferritin